MSHLKPRSKTCEREPGGVDIMPRVVVDNPNYKMLSGIAHKLLYNLLHMYRGKNNGDLSPSMKLLQEYGWTSNHSLTEARQELLHYGFIIQTRPGGKNQAELFALTFLSIAKSTKHYMASRHPTGEWRKEKPKYLTKYQCKKKLKTLHRNPQVITPNFSVVK